MTFHTFSFSHSWKVKRMVMKMNCKRLIAFYAHVTSKVECIIICMKQERYNTDVEHLPNLDQFCSEFKRIWLSRCWSWIGTVNIESISLITKVQIKHKWHKRKRKSETWREHPCVLLYLVYIIILFFFYTNIRYLFCCNHLDDKR